MTTEERNLHGWLKQAEDFRDYQLTALHPELLTAVPESFDLRSTGILPPGQNQGSLGSCVAWGCGHAFRYAQRKNGLPDFDGSELFTYYNARAYQGWQNQDSGAYVRDGMKALAEFGLADESTWPYNIGAFTQKPPVTSYANGLGHQALRYMAVTNQQQLIKQTIAGGFPVVFGIPLFQNWPMSGGVFDIPAPQGQVIGGHCMYVVGYDSTGVIVGNQWGDDWGINGFARIPWSYFLGQASDLWTLEVTEGEPPTPPEPPKPVLFYVTAFREYFSDGSFWDIAAVPPPSA